VSLKNFISIHSHHWGNLSLSEVFLDFSGWGKGTLIHCILVSYTTVLYRLKIEGPLTCSSIFIHSSRLRLINCLTYIRHRSMERSYSSGLGQGLSKVRLNCIAVRKLFQHFPFSSIKVSSLQYSGSIADFKFSFTGPSITLNNAGVHPGCARLQYFRGGVSPGTHSVVSFLEVQVIDGAMAKTVFSFKEFRSVQLACVKFNALVVG